MTTTGTATDPQPYALRWPAALVAPPELDPAQRDVVDAVAAPGCGPVLVLAGPGTGKTTTIVESVAARVRSGTPPERVLVLTFSRKASQELRARLGARLAVATAEPLAWTFHGFCFALLADAAARSADPAGPPRLLSGPDQDVALRELVAGAVADGRARWPRELGPALATRGFADELRRLLARARSLGLEPQDLADASSRPDWLAAAHFFDEYLDVLDARGVVDYSELVLRAARVVAGPEGDALRARYDLVLVDEYQDTDPAQEALLRGLAGDGRDLVVVGDPDQSIYGFRGADVSNILEFAHRFPRPDGSPARVRALTVGRRSGPALLAASRSVAAPLPVLTGVPPEVRAAHRDLVAAGAPHVDLVQARTYPHDAAEADAIADRLRREHLEHGRPWESMAVLVRSVGVSGPRIRRALTAAGVPVEVAADEVPLAAHPAVEALRVALECAVDLASPIPTGLLTPERAHQLLLSPLGGADARAVRLLGRALRAEDRPADGPDASGVGPRPSAELVRDAVLDPRVLVGLEPRVADPARRVATLLAEAATLVRANAPAYDVVWSIWSGTPWPARLEAAARRGGAEGRRADQDLDAVLALFDVAARHDESGLGTGAANLSSLLTAQQIPGDTLAERGVRPGGVRLLTAHRAKGLEWDVVVVAGVQDELWPDLRRRGSLLEADRLGADGLTEPMSTRELLTEERRLFYVAVTRARQVLLVTAVDSAVEDGARPSRFLDELGVEVEHVATPVRRPLALRALVADLRRTAGDPNASPGLRRAAVARLGVLAEAVEGDRVLVPSADPDRWWGVAEPTQADRPIRPEDRPLHLSGSSLRGLGECPAKWMLAHEVRAEGARGSALGFGSVLHALAEGVDRGVLAPDLDTLMAALDEVWGQLEFAAPWQRELERTAARDALGRFLRWHEARADEGRRPVATEAPFELTVEVDLTSSRAREVVLRGAVDRVDVDAADRVVIVDYKTGRYAPKVAQVAVDPQLATYQLAVERGALDDVLPLGLAGSEDVSGGAELVQLRHELAGGVPKVQAQPPLRAAAAGRSDIAQDVADGAGGGTDSGSAAWFDRVLASAARRIVDEDLPAIVGDGCATCAFASSCPAQDAGRQVVS